MVQFACDPMQGLACKPGGCEGACTPQKLGRKQIGCDFWPTVTANSVWKKWFPFGVVVVNTTDQTANLVVTRGDTVVERAELAPDEVETIALPWIDDLKGPDASDNHEVVPPKRSVLSKSSEGGGAYRLRSDQPVVVTQFSTLRSSNPAGLASGCPPDPDTKDCLSYSNDATLLMPAPTFGSSHVLMGWRAWRFKTGPYETGGIGDFVSVTAVENDTTVDITASSPILRLPKDVPFEPGQTRKFVLHEGDVLQLFTDPEYKTVQWAGSRLLADRPVQVLTGAPCVNVPDDRPTCDHLEESNLPVGMLGKSYLVTAPTSPSGRNRHVIRIHGIENETLVEFDPPTAHNAITVKEGEVVELDFALETKDTNVPQDFLVSSSKVFGVTQYMVGSFDPPASSPGADLGDPSQTVLVPTSRYLRRYVIALPPGFDQHRVHIVAATGSEVFINDEPLDESAVEFRAIGASGLSVARLSDLQPSQRYELRSDKAFGVQVCGFGRFTSYMFPGGIDLRPLSQ